MSHNQTGQRQHARGDILKEAIFEALRNVTDGATSLRVTQTDIIKELSVDEAAGVVGIRLRPNSPVCPLAFTLGKHIREAVLGVSGVRSVRFRVENFSRAAELESVLNVDPAGKSHA